MSSPAEADQMFARAGLGDVPRLSDPDGALYRAMGLGTVAPATFASPTLWVRGFQSGVLAGRGFAAQSAAAIRQLPGVFLMHAGLVLREYRHQSPADRPDYLALITG